MAVIVSIDHSTNDFTQYSGTDSDGTFDGTITAGAALAGTNYGFNVLINDANYDIALYNFNKVTILRARFYIDPNSLNMTNDWTGPQIFQVTQTGGSWLDLFTVKIQYYTPTYGGYNITFTAHNDAYTAVFNEDRCQITDAPHYVEVLCIRATNSSSNDGTYQWWVDGVDQGSLTNVDNYNIMFDYNFRMNTGSINSWNATTGGSYFIDEIVMNNDGGLIGPVASSPTLNTRKTLLGVGK